MTKRMTAEEVAKRIERIADACDGGQSALVLRQAAVIVRENLVPQWQDEPEENGVYRINGTEGVYAIRKRLRDGLWMALFLATEDGLRRTYNTREPLNGRQVCPIGARPR